MTRDESLNMADDVLADGHLWVQVALYLRGVVSGDMLLHAIDMTAESIKESQRAGIRDDYERHA